MHMLAHICHLIKLINKARTVNCEIHLKYSYENKLADFTASSNSRLDSKTCIHSVNAEQNSQKQIIYSYRISHDWINYLHFTFSQPTSCEPHSLQTIGLNHLLQCWQLPYNYIILMTYFLSPYNFFAKNEQLKLSHQSNTISITMLNWNIPTIIKSIALLFRLWNKSKMIYIPHHKHPTFNCKISKLVQSIYIPDKKIYSSTVSYAQNDWHVHNLVGQTYTVCNLTP